MESYECDVVVIGGGLSGLSCALYLAEIDKGLRVLVLEAKGKWIEKLPELTFCLD